MSRFFLLIRLAFLGTIIFFCQSIAQDVDDLSIKAELRWLTNSIYAPTVEIKGVTYERATIRKAGPASVMVRHDGGFFAESITNIPKSIRTNLLYHAPKEVIDYLRANTNINLRYGMLLLRGETNLSGVKEAIAWEEKKAEELRAEDRRAAQNARRKAAAREASEKAEDDAHFRKFPDVPRCIREQKICIGMRYQDVIASWGYPSRRNESVSPTGRTAQWVYEQNDAYLYFNEDGLLRSWQVSK